jgi:predicted amidophosphoribosyltransferase
MRAYKFDAVRGWALIFARILLGFLDDHFWDFCDHDLILANPAYNRKSAAPKRNNAQFIISTASEIDVDDWPFDISPPAIIKTRDTTAMKGKTWQQRQEIAEAELRATLSIPDVSRTRGKSVIVLDDLYTTGHTLNEVARCLIEVGKAQRVTGLSLARQLYPG